MHKTPQELVTIEGNEIVNDYVTSVLLESAFENED